MSRHPPSGAGPGNPPRGADQQGQHHAARSITPEHDLRPSCKAGVVGSNPTRGSRLDQAKAPDQDRSGALVWPLTSRADINTGGQRRSVTVEPSSEQPVHVADGLPLSVLRHMRVHVHGETGLAVPRISMTTRGATPAAVSRVAQPCRASCSRIFRSLAFLATRVKDRYRLRGSTGRPVRVAKTYPDGFNAPSVCKHEFWPRRTKFIWPHQVFDCWAGGGLEHRRSQREEAVRGQDEPSSTGSRAEPKLVRTVGPTQVLTNNIRCCHGASGRVRHPFPRDAPNEHGNRESVVQLTLTRTSTPDIVQSGAPRPRRPSPATDPRPHELTDPAAPAQPGPPRASQPTVLTHRWDYAPPGGNGSVPCQRFRRRGVPPSRADGRNLSARRRT
jgi:hypothetical protein